MADDLRRRTPEQLVALLLTRPDLARPEPVDVTALAARAGTQGSVHRALDRLDTGLLLVLEAACRADDPIDEGAVAAQLGTSQEQVEARAAELWLRGLLWRDDRGLHATRGVLDALRAPPGPVADRGTSAPQGDQRAGQARLTPPEVPLSVLPAGQIDASGGLHASLILELVDQLAAVWGQSPPRVLRERGLAVRDLAHLEGLLGIDKGAAANLVETCWEAGLVADDGALEPVWAPTTAYDDWRELPAVDRWLRVGRAWLDMPRAPHLLLLRRQARPGTPHSAEPGGVNALSRSTHWPVIRTLRRLVLEQLEAVPADASPDRGAFAARVRWLLPRADPVMVDTVTTAVLSEAEFLGLCASGALTQAGRALLSGSDDEARSHLSKVLPPAATTMVLQADLTAVVPGRLEGALADVLRAASDVESRGGASVHRFSPDSVRRWFDLGRSADELLDRLSESSLTPVPQPLSYLVEDVSRRHGQVTVGAVSSYATCEDPGVLDAVMARREVAGLGLRRLAPTVVVCQRPASVLVARLRQAELAPLVEAADGQRVGTSVPRRAQSAYRQAPGSSPARGLLPDPDDIARMVNRLLAAAHGASRSPGARNTPAAGPEVPGVDPAVALALVREALDDHCPVWLGVVDATGTKESILFHPTRIDAGRLSGTAEGSSQPRSIALHRITGALTVEEA